MNIIDIANLCGVSKSTVSRYLNGGYVSKATASKIASAIERTGYEYNAAAAQLKTKKSGLIGVIIDGIESQSIMRTIAGINEGCREQGHLPFIAFEEPDQDEKAAIIRRLAGQGVDAIIYGSAHVSAEHRRCLLNCGKPSLLLGQYDPALPHIKVDDYGAGFLMGNHVVEAGAKDIVYLNFPHGNRALGVERLGGFVEACERRGVTVKPIEADYPHYADLHVQIDEALALHPDCIACGSDAMALLVLDELEKRGIACPDKIMISGFGDNRSSSLHSVSLTTVQFDYRELGRSAARMAISLTTGDPFEVPDVTYGMKLMARKTTQRTVCR